MTLAKLVPVIAGYRDEFYNDLIQKLPEHHRKRLILEANDRHQPFGAARQDINSRLSVQRDRQLIHCRLAQVYAGMGYREAALAEAAVVPVAAARINAQMDCLLGTARGQIIEGELDKAAETLPQIFSLLKRGIKCSAIVDPWNIIGFDGNYSLFPAIENSIRDHRVDDLVELIESDLFGLLRTLDRSGSRQSTGPVQADTRTVFGFRGVVATICGPRGHVRRCSGPSRCFRSGAACCRSVEFMASRRGSDRQPGILGTARPHVRLAKCLPPGDRGPPRSQGL